MIEYITPGQFDLYGDIARSKGFAHVASGPLVRSSYHAADFHPVVRKSVEPVVAGIGDSGRDVVASVVAGIGDPGLGAAR